MVNLSGCFLFVLAFNFQIQCLHYCVWRKCCLLCKQFDSFCYPRKQVYNDSGWPSKSPIEIVSWIIASGPRWHSKEILLVYQQCQICCFSDFLICQSKGNSQSFMCYRLATTCIYVNSSWVFNGYLIQYCIFVPTAVAFLLLQSIRCLFSFILTGILLIQRYAQCWFFLDKALVIVSPAYFVYNFSTKMFLMLHSINWPNFIAWLQYWDIGQYLYCNCLLL